MPSSTESHRQNSPSSMPESPSSNSNVPKMVDDIDEEKGDEEEAPKPADNYEPKELDNDDASSRPQYAEYQTCPLPELAVDPQGAPEPLSNLDDRSIQNGVQPDIDYNAIRSPAIVYAEPDRSWLAKHKSWVVFGLVSAVLLLSGVIAAVVISHNVQSRSGGGGSGGDASSVSSTVSSILSILTPSPTLGTTISPTVAPTPSTSGCSPSVYVANVSWMGVDNSPGNWKVSYSAAADAAACCKICYDEQREGCDGWAYMPSSNSLGTTCNMIVGYVGPNSDLTCPYGYTGVKFNRDATDPSFVGGAGPCATVAS